LTVPENARIDGPHLQNLQTAACGRRCAFSFGPAFAQTPIGDPDDDDWEDGDTDEDEEDEDEDPLQARVLMAAAG
jgi:hypothetical protein